MAASTCFIQTHPVMANKAHLSSYCEDIGHTTQLEYVTFAVTTGGAIKGWHGWKVRGRCDLDLCCALNKKILTRQRQWRRELGKLTKNWHANPLARLQFLHYLALWLYMQRNIRYKRAVFKEIARWSVNWLYPLVMIAVPWTRILV